MARRGMPLAEAACAVMGGVSLTLLILDATFSGEAVDQNRVDDRRAIAARPLELNDGKKAAEGSVDKRSDAI